MTILRWEHHWGEPERAPHWRVARTSVLYHHHHHHYHHISIYCTAYPIFLFRPKRMAIIYKRWNIHVTWSPIEAKSTCRLLFYSTLAGTMLRSSSNMATSESLFGSVCSQIALTERIILNAAHNYQRLWKLSRKCPPGVSAPFPLLHGLLELPVFASQFAVPTIFSSIFWTLQNAKSQAIANRLLFNPGLPHASTSHLSQRMSTNDRRTIAYNSLRLTPTMIVICLVYLVKVQKVFQD